MTATADLPNANFVDTLIGNADGRTVLINMIRLAALMAQRIGPSYQTRAQLLADLAWGSGSVGGVWNDPNAAYNGTYRKDGSGGAGTWTRIGDLPTTSIGMDQLALKADKAVVDILAAAGNAVYLTRTEARNAAPDLPPAILRLINLEGSAMVVRGRGATGDDPLHGTGDPWGVVMRLDQNAVTAEMRNGRVSYVNADSPSGAVLATGTKMAVCQTGVGAYSFWQLGGEPADGLETPELKRDAAQIWWRRRVDLGTMATQLAEVMPLTTRVAVDASAPIAAVHDPAGQDVMTLDSQGGLHLAGLEGQSVQRVMRGLEERVKAASVPVSHAVSPYLAKLTDAQNASYGWVDQLGELYLPGMGDQSVQRRLAQMQRALAASAGAGSSGAASPGIVVDVVADLGCDRNFGEEVATKINAFTAGVVARRGRATVYFPAGDYKITTSIIPRSGITFAGAGWNRAVIRPVASQAAFHRIAVSAPVEHCHFLGLHVDGSEQTLLNGNQYNVFCKGISLVGNRYCTVIGNYVHDTGATSIANDFAYAGWVVNNRVEGSGRLGTVGIAGSSGIGIGVGMWQEEPCLIHGNQVSGARNYGIFLERQTNGNSAYANCRGYVISSNDVSECNYGIGDCGAEELIIEGNRAHDNTQAGIVLHAGTVNAEPGQRTLIRGNQIYRNMDGIRYVAAASALGEGFVSEGNQIALNTRDGIRIDTSAYAGSIDNIASQGDTIRRNGGAAVNLVAGSVKNFDIMSSRLIENTGAAIRLDGAVTGGSIAGNRIRDMRVTRAQTAAIAGAGALTDVDIDANQYIGPGPAVAMTGTQTRVTYGRNQGI